MVGHSGEEVGQVTTGNNAVKAGQTAPPRSNSEHFNYGRSGLMLDKALKVSQAFKFRQYTWCCTCSTSVSPLGAELQ